SHAAGHQAPRLDLTAEVPAPAVLVPPLERIEHAVTVGVGPDVELADRVQRLARHRDQGMEPAVPSVLSAAFPAEDRAGPVLGGLTARDGHAELERMIRAELEKSAHPAREERILEGRAAEGRVVVTVEDSAERLDVEGQVRDERCLEPLFLQPLIAEKVANDVRAVDPRQVVLVKLSGASAAVCHMSD